MTVSGGGGRIRTHGTLTSTAVFKTAAFNHSATPPHCKINRLRICFHPVTLCAQVYLNVPLRVPDPCPYRQIGYMSFKPMSRRLRSCSRPKYRTHSGRILRRSASTTTTALG